MLGAVLAVGLWVVAGPPPSAVSTTAVPLVSTLMAFPGPEAPPVPPRPRSLQSILVERVGKVLMTSAPAFMLLGMVGGVLTLGVWAVASMGILGPIGLPITIGIIAGACVSIGLAVFGVLMAPAGVAMNIAGPLIP